MLVTWFADGFVPNKMHTPTAITSAPARRPICSSAETGIAHSSAIILQTARRPNTLVLPTPDSKLHLASLIDEDFTNIATNTMTAVAKLRDLLKNPGYIACPGVYDGMSARAALMYQPQALYATGAGMTASRLGLADLAYATQDDFVSCAGMIASCDRKVPVIADADTGFGASTQVARTVERYIQAGIAGLHIEDQSQSKRCGHLQGKVLVPVDEFASRMRAAVLGRQKSGGDIVIIARTDAMQSFGIDESIARLRAAVEAGADVAFFEGAHSKEDISKVVEALKPTPVLLNLVQGGDTPHFSIPEMEEMGVKLGIYPTVALMPALVACMQSYKQLKETGTYADAPMSLRQFFAIHGLEESLALDKAAGGTTFTNGI